MTIEEAIIEKVRALSYEGQVKVLRFADSLSAEADANRAEELAVEEAKQWLRDNPDSGIRHAEVLAELGLTEDEFWRMGEEKARRRA